MTGRTLWLEGVHASAVTDALVVAGRQWDVVVVGAGVAGLAAALGVLRSGRTVCVIDARRVGEGTTGHATVKVTTAHGDALERIAERHGEQIAAAYQRANDEGFRWLERVISDADAIAEVDWARVEHVICAQSRSALHRTASVVAAAGGEVKDVPPFRWSSGVAVTWGASALVHPVKLARRLAALLVAEGGSVLEGTRIVAIEPGDDLVDVRSEDGQLLRAGHVVVATHSPMYDPGLLVPRMTYTWHAAIASPATASVPAAIDVDPGGLSTRPVTMRDGREFAVVVGPACTLDELNTGQAFDDLAARASTCLGVGPPAYQWSAHDATSPGLVPVLARAPRHPRVLLCTGMNGWGFTNAAAMALDLPRILDDPEDESTGGLWRYGLSGSPSTLATAAGRTTKEMTQGYLHTLSTDDDQAIPPGSGVVTGGPLSPRAVSRTLDGALHTVSARCTHMGCIVGWNSNQQAWECPCHGSMFGPDGCVLAGPASQPLADLASDR